MNNAGHLVDKAAVRVRGQEWGALSAECGVTSTVGHRGPRPASAHPSFSLAIKQ